ncbi:TrmH family RNA methyltransferase [Deinococcus humi]|uniref:TrmH family RNA methyltransferase n=1 Tax=Deinococcus humi TaxID=662880 RepID=A0A7W8NDI6_9DEIO|nr:RNA methyltransferase [Deinococcus humi]MBB5362431.1 TrmH family RNA methyltransferase [Deinococcus humi]GGO28858.1 rRNA methyltransferase [Deinococcus humi]
MTRADPITSLQNPQLKRLVRLHTRRSREQEAVILIEGARELSRALAAGVQPTEIFSAPELHSPEAAEVAPTLPTLPTLLSPAAFEKVSGRENPDGLLAVAPRPAVMLPDLPGDAVVVVLDGLEKPGNVGAILRTADASGAAAVLVLGRGADPYGPNVIRASQGSVFALPVVALDEEAAQDYLTAQGCVMVACTPDAPHVYWDAPLTGRVALLLGTEHGGLPTHWRQAGSHGSGLSVRIPMEPGSAADSLNVATAAALMLFECARQRRGTGAAGAGQ